MNWPTIIIAVILIVIVALAVRPSIKHFKGRGGCCGGDDIEVERKKLDRRAICRKTVKIEGMRCDNCKKRVENAINEIDGAVAEVSLKRNTAVVKTDREVGDDEIKRAIEALDFKVINIISEELK